MKKLLVFGLSAFASMAVAAQSGGKDNKQAKKDDKQASAAGVPGSTEVAQLDTSSVQLSESNPVNAAAGTNQLAADVALPTKKWGASVVTQSSVAGDSVYHISNRDTTVQNLVYAGVTYRTNDENTFGVRQYLNYNFAPAEATGAADNRAEMSWTTLTFTRKFDGIFGSDKISPMFWYYLPTHQSARDVDHNGIFRLDVEFDWTINPKWTVGYYLNPRQSFVPGNRFAAGADGKQSAVESTTNIYHWAIAYYNVSDKFQPYAFIGANHQFRTNDGMRSKLDKAVAAIGAQYSIGKNIILNPEIDAEEVLTTEGEVQTASARWLQNDDFTYLMTAVVSF